MLGSTNLYGLFSHHHVQFLELVGHFVHAQRAWPAVARTHYKYYELHDRRIRESI